MKLKRIVLIGLVMAMIGAGAVNAQVSFIDQWSFGMSLGLSEAKGDPPVNDGLFDNCHFIMDYWLGAYVQYIDSAIYAGFRWDLDYLDAGLMLDYHFTNSVGFSLGGGAEVLRTNIFGNTYNEKPEHEITPYVRVGAFLHFVTEAKLGVDFTYKTNGQQRLGIYVSASMFSLFNRMTDYQPIRRTSNRDLIGQWVTGDTVNGMELIIGDDFTAGLATYKDNRLISTQVGTWATSAPGELWDTQISFVMNGKAFNFGYELLDADTMITEVDDLENAKWEYTTRYGQSGLFLVIPRETHIFLRVE